MYAVPNKTQHKLIVKVRGGISQNLDKFSSNNGPSSSSNPSYQDSKKSLSSLISDNKLALQSSPFKSVPIDVREPTRSKQLDEAGFNAELNHLPQPIFYTNGGKPKTTSQRVQRRFITPEHSEMIKYVQQTWKGVERDYKRSVNNYINNIDLNNSSDRNSPGHTRQRHVDAKKKTATISTPLLLSGSYHHTSVTKESSSGRQDSFQPFDLEAFWGNRILQRLTETQLD